MFPPPLSHNYFLFPPPPPPPYLSQLITSHLRSSMSPLSSSPLVRHYCCSPPITVSSLWMYTNLAVRLTHSMLTQTHIHSSPLSPSFSCSAATVPSPIITACQKELIFSFLIKTCKKLPCYYNAATLWRHRRKPNLISEILSSHIKLNT